MKYNIVFNNNDNEFEVGDCCCFDDPNKIFVISKFRKYDTIRMSIRNYKRYKKYKKTLKRKGFKKKGN